MMMILVGLTQKSYAQQAALVANYDMLSNIQNPAYNGLNRRLQVDAVSRVQWANFPGSPTYTGVGFQVPVNKDFAIGGNMQTLSIGEFKYASPLSMGSYVVDLAYHKQVAENTFISAGVRTGLFSFNMRISQLVASEVGDVGQIGNDYSFNSPLVGGGIMVYGKQYFIGVSMPQFAVVNDRLIENVNLGYNARSSYLFNAGYIQNLRSGFSAKTTTQLRWYEGLPLLYELNAYLLWEDFVQAGYGYRSTGSHAILGKVKVNDYFYVIYTYEFGHIYDKNTPFNSTEFGLSYQIDYNKQKTKVVPRYY
jgi:type IX secretion system PorP/SprF family membrane protein